MARITLSAVVADAEFEVTLFPLRPRLTVPSPAPEDGHGPETVTVNGSPQ
jgi:hypothetical protein